MSSDYNYNTNTNEEFEISNHKNNSKENNYEIPNFNNDYVSRENKFLLKKRLRTTKYYLEQNTQPEDINQAIKEVFLTNKNIEEHKEDEENENDNKMIQKTKKNKKKIFEAKRLKNRGRKRKAKELAKKNNKVHGKNDYDNVITKIQVHFINFIRNLTNDIIHKELNKDKEFFFKDIQYMIKKNINFQNMEKIKSLKIEDILCKPISKKFKSLDEDYNKLVYNKINKIIKGKKHLDFLNEFFNMDYEILFRTYFNDSKKILKFKIKEKEIIFSNKTKPFYKLIEKRNELVKKLFIKYCKRAYFGIDEENENYNSKSIFITKKNN